MKHTTGPWDCDGMGDIFPKNENHLTIAHVNDFRKEHGYANARLIAAAPQMEDALWAIANMQVEPETNHAQLSALCISIAQIALAELKRRES